MKYIIPTSANPLHIGHKEIYNYIHAMHDNVAFGLSVVNADKGSLDDAEIGKRIHQFEKYNYILLHHPTFAQLSQVYDNTYWCVGADTINRIGHPKYYNNSLLETLHAITQIRRHNCRFLVFPRQGIELNIPIELKELCEFSQFVPTGISSTEIRSRK